MGVGVTTNYMPEQPIAFSHKLHAGMNGVDCNYCHSSARHSKHSGIPAANVCMNCHTYINEGQDAAGRKKYKKYIMPLVSIQILEPILKDMNKQPIKMGEFIIYRDHAYFNHSQHVVAEV